MIEHRYWCQSAGTAERWCDCQPISPDTEPSTGSAVLDDLAQRLAATGDVLTAATVFVASVDLQWSPAFRALADAVEKAQPGAVAVTRKALGR